MPAAPAVAVTLEALQEPSAPVTVRPVGVATTSPLGSESVKFTPLFPRVAPVTTNVSVVVSPTEIAAAPNDSAIVGVFCPRSCAAPGLANENVISTPITAAHTVAGQCNLCARVPT